MNSNIRKSLDIVQTFVIQSLEGADEGILRYMADKAECEKILKETATKLRAVLDRNTPLLNGDWSGHEDLRERLMKEHSRIESVKIVREETDLELRDAIDVVDALRLYYEK